MMNRRLLLLALLPLLSMASPAPQGEPSSPQAARLQIATWNMEWLVDPDTARAARIACREHRPTALPCDVALGLARDSADLAHLAAIARRLDADVIAFQEVQDARIARRVFRGYRICMSDGAGLQHVGFALRAGLATDCGQPLDALAVTTQARAGLQLTLHPPGSAPLELLAVHLKSGCAHEPLDTPTDACRLLARQASVLSQWIAARSARHAPFIVLGDFNRGGLPTAKDPFWRQFDPRTFEDSASRLRFTNCVFGAPYRDFIDHILVGQALVARLGPDAFRQHPYRPAEAAHYQLSDHCPVSVSLNVAADL